jgi:hypothetical protein
MGRGHSCVFGITIPRQSFARSNSMNQIPEGICFGRCNIKLKRKAHGPLNTETPIHNFRTDADRQRICECILYI